MSAPAYFVGLDVGGTTMKAGVVDDEGRPCSSVSLPTEAHRGQEFGLERMCETIRLAVTDCGLGFDCIAAVGVATPGLMDIAAGVIFETTNLGPWRRVHVRDHLAGAFQKPTAFQNDANAAAYGEFWAGAGRSVNSMVLFTLGTGVGGGIILGGRILQGEHSHGGELGHMQIEVTNPRRCGCGRPGCLEAYASAPAVVRRTQEALGADTEQSVLAPHFGSLTAADVFKAADAGDALATRIVDETALYLAVAAANLMHAVDPDLVLFGGGMIAAGPSFLERIRRHIRARAFPIPAERTEVRYAQLGGDAGFIGAAGCARLLVCDE